MSESSVFPHHGPLEVIGFHAAYEIGLARSQCFHQGIQRLTELANQSRYTLLGIKRLLSDTNKCHMARVVTYNNAIFIIRIVSALSKAEAKDRTDPDAVGGRGDDHPGVGAALDRRGGQLIVKRLFEEFIGGALHQLNQI